MGRSLPEGARSRGITSCAGRAMPGPLTPLGAQWLLDPDQARATVLAALRAAEGNVVHAAEALSVSRRQLSRRIAGDRAIARELARIRAAKGAASDTDVIALSARKASVVDESYDTRDIDGKKSPKKRTKPRVA